MCYNQLCWSSRKLSSTTFLALQIVAHARVTYLADVFDSVLYFEFALLVERTGGLVKDENIWAPNKSTRYSQPLLLTA